jgi:hypothetical protein
MSALQKTPPVHYSFTITAANEITDTNDTKHELLTTDPDKRIPQTENKIVSFLTSEMHEYCSGGGGWYGGKGRELTWVTLRHEAGETSIDRAVGVTVQMDSTCSTTGNARETLATL